MIQRRGSGVFSFLLAGAALGIAALVFFGGCSLLQKEKENPYESESSPVISEELRQELACLLADIQEELEINEENLDKIIQLLQEKFDLDEAALNAAIKSFQADLDTREEKKETMYRLLNEERQEKGLSPVEYSQELTAIAQLRAEEMARLRHLSGNSPTYGLPYQMALNFGVIEKDTWVNENRVLAGDVKEAHEAIMESEGHRYVALYYRNMNVGFGIARFDRDHEVFVQMFTLPMRKFE